MKILIRSLLLASGGFLVVSATAESPFTMTGWQFHEYDVPKVEEAIQRAPDYGVNFVIFSHELFRSVEGFLASDEELNLEHPPAYLKELYTPSRHFRLIPHWQKDINHLGEMANERGIDWYLWIHEFDDLPKRFITENYLVNMDHPDLFPYLDSRYQKLIDAAPETAGFVLTFHESNRKPFRRTEVKSELDIPSRLERITRVIYEVAKRNGKTLILRNFFYEPREMEFSAEALRRLPDDIIVMSKTTVHEFHPFYPPDPMHGAVGEKKQIIEIDLGVEKVWSSHGAYAQTEYIQRYVRRAREKSLAGMVGRCRFKWDNHFENSHEINLYAFARFMKDPNLSVQTVLEDWASLRYPAEVVPDIASAFSRTQFINFRGRWPLENWLTKSIGDQWGDYRYYYGHLLQRSRFKWTGNPADQELENRLYHPDRQIYEQLVEEKEEVIRQVEASIADIKRASRHLTPSQFAPLREDFAFLLDAARLQREWIRAYFAMRLYMEDPQEEYRMWSEDALRKLEQIEKTPGVTWGLNKETGRRYNIDLFVLEMRWRMANRSRAMAEDERILERVRKRANVNAN